MPVQVDPQAPGQFPGLVTYFETGGQYHHIEDFGLLFALGVKVGDLEIIVVGRGNFGNPVADETNAGTGPRPGCNTAHSPCRRPGYPYKK